MSTFELPPIEESKLQKRCVSSIRPGMLRSQASSRPHTAATLGARATSENKKRKLPPVLMPLKCEDSVEALVYQHLMVPFQIPGV